MKHYLQFSDLDAAEYSYLLQRAALIKGKFKAYDKHQPLADRTLAMIFEKASTRTRVSFEAGMYQLGGSVVHLTTGDEAHTHRTVAQELLRDFCAALPADMARAFATRPFHAFLREVATVTG